MSEVAQKSKRGFASLSPERRKEIASNGGKKAHALGFAHKFTSAEAKVAGRKGGLAISADSAHMAKIGSLGGKNRHKKKLPVES